MELLKVGSDLETYQLITSSLYAHINGTTSYNSFPLDHVWINAELADDGNYYTSQRYSQPGNEPIYSGAVWVGYKGGDLPLFRFVQFRVIGNTYGLAGNFSTGATSPYYCEFYKQ
jgi:hypothetical protein